MLSRSDNSSFSVVSTPKGFLYEVYEYERTL